MKRPRILSGMRPTGPLHLGNFMGALDNRVRLQDTYECLFMIADWHSLTTDYADTSRVKQSIIDIGLDWLSSGLDPEKCTMFIQSGRQPIQPDLDDALPHPRRVGIVRRQRVPVSDEEEAVVFVLQPDPVLQCAHVVAQVQLARRPHPAQHAPILRSISGCAR